MNIGVITSGGDCPGLNAILFGIVRACEHHQLNLLGIAQHAVNIDKPHYSCTKLSSQNIDRFVLQQGGTILGTIVDADTLKHDPERSKIMGKELHAIMQENNIDVLILIAGDSGIRIIQDICHTYSIPMVAVPKTIDNDVKDTEFAIGYLTCVETVVDALDKIQSTAFSHKRVMFVEVMGRHAGHIALMSGIAAGVDAILIPENSYDFDTLCDFILNRYNENEKGVMVVVAEGIKKSTTEELAKSVEQKLNIPVRSSKLGHLQRGGKPSYYDRFMGLVMGQYAVKLVNEKQFDHMVVWQNGMPQHVKIKNNLQNPIQNVSYWKEVTDNLEIYIGI